MLHKLEHAASGIFHNRPHHDPRVCETCRIKFGNELYREIPLRSHPDASLPTRFSRFALIIDQKSTLDIARLESDLDTCFKIQLTRICANQATFVPATQEHVDSELLQLSKLVKPHHHLFIYTNAHFEMNLEKFHQNANIWLIADFPNAAIHYWQINAHNVVAVCASERVSLVGAWSEMFRETLEQLMQRLAGAKLISQKPDSTFFGFG
jgi:hypothetical protein